MLNADGVPMPMSIECVTRCHQGDSLLVTDLSQVVPQSGAHQASPRPHCIQATVKWSEAENLFLFSLINMGVFNYDTLCINLNRRMKTYRTRGGVKKHIERMVADARQLGYLHTDSFHNSLRVLAHDYVVERVLLYRLLLFDSTLDKSFFDHYLMQDESMYFMRSDFLYHFLINFSMDDFQVND